MFGAYVLFFILRHSTCPQCLWSD